MCTEPGNVASSNRQATIATRTARMPYRSVSERINQSNYSSFPN